MQSYTKLCIFVKKQEMKKNKMVNFIQVYYPVLLAFICLIYALPAFYVQTLYVLSDDKTVLSEIHIYDIQAFYEWLLVLCVLIRQMGKER